MLETVDEDILVSCLSKCRNPVACIDMTATQLDQTAACLNLHGGLRVSPSCSMIQDTGVSVDTSS